MVDESLKSYMETQRLILRNWQLDDAEALYKYASDSRVSALALWPRHESVEMSRWVIEELFLPNPWNFFEGKLIEDSPYLNKDVSAYPFGSGSAIRYI